MFGLNRILNRKPESEKNLNRGKRSDESGEKDSNPTEGFLCPTCFAEFSTAEQLMHHFENAHSVDTSVASDVGNYSIMCPVCKLVHDSKDEFMTHYLIHGAPSGKVELDVLLNEVANLSQDKKMLGTKIDDQTKRIGEFEDELTSYKAKCKELTMRSEKLELNLNLLDAKVEETTSAKKSLELRVDKLKRENMDLKVEIDQRPSADDVAVLKQEIVSVQRMMDQVVVRAEEDMASLNDQYQVLKVHCESLQTANDRLKADIACLSSDLETQCGKILALKNELKVKDEECNSMRDKLQCTEKNLETTTMQLHQKKHNVEELKNQLEVERNQLQQLKLDRSELFTKIQEGEGTNAAMMQLKEENSRLHDQVVLQQANFSNDMASTMEKLQSLSLERDQLKTRLEEAMKITSTLEASFSHWRLELQNISRQKDLLYASVQNEKDFHKTYSDKICAELDKVKHQYEFVKNELKESHDFMECVADHIKMIIQRDVPTKDIELKNQELKAHGCELLKVLPLLRETIRKSHCVETLEAEILNLKEEVNAKEKELSTLRPKLQESESLLQERKELDKTIELLDQNVKMLTELNAVLVEEKSSLCDSLRGTEKALGVKDNTCKELQSQLEEKDATLHSLQSALNEKDAICKTLQSSLNEKDTLCQSLQSALDEKNEHVEEQQSHLDESLSELQSVKEFLVNLKIQHRKNVEEMQQKHEQKIESIRKEAHDKQLQMKELSSANIALEHKMKNLEDLLHEKHAASEESSRHYTAQIALLQENIATVKIDLETEQCRRKQAEQKVNELCGAKLELEAKLDNALEERKALLERCLRSEAENEKLLQNNADLRRKLDDSVAALQELGRENQTLQVESVKHQGRKWADDTEVDHCTACGKSFSVTIRKHHCRNCGSIFCNDCSSKTAAVAASKKPVRVCDLCYDELTK